MAFLVSNLDYKGIIDNTCEPCSDCRAFIYNEEYFPLIIKYDLLLERYIERIKPECIRKISSEYAIMYKKVNEVPPMGDIGYKTYPKCYGLMAGVTNTESMIAADQIKELGALGLHGRGTLIGIIDTGIDYTLDIFKSGSLTRILAAWDQEESEFNGDYPYLSGYGRVYTRDEINKAIQSENPFEVIPDLDRNGHGTSLASVAAGGAYGNGNRGIADEASIVAVRLKNANASLKNYYGIPVDVDAFSEDDIMQAINFILDVARKNEMPVVIILGVGSSQGGHDGSTYLEQYIDRLSSLENVFFSVAAGNELLTYGHFHGRTSSIDTTAELLVDENETDFAFEIWADFPTIADIYLRSPSGQSLRLLDRGEERFIYEGTTVYSELIISDEGFGGEVAVVRFRNPGEGIWTITVRGDELIAGDIDMYLPIRTFLKGETAFLNADVYGTICSPACSEECIAVAGYNYLENRVYLNSSRGYTRREEIKPDIAAPAAEVPVVGRKGLTGYSSGTSIAAACTAGAVALLLEWAFVRGNMPYINSKQIKRFLIRGAKRNSDTMYPNRENGYGNLNVKGIFDELISMPRQP